MSEAIVCKPTPWFLLRGVAMVVMFAVFAVLFYRDGSSGYREKNLSYYSRLGVERAIDEFGRRKDGMTPEAWRAFAAEQAFDLPEDRTILPPGTPERISWPGMLGDWELMTEGMQNADLVFDRYMEEAELSKSPPEQAYDAGKIREQWIVFWIALAATLVSLFFLLRTLRRRMTLEGDRFGAPGAKPVPIDELVRLDLRKWERKGLAFAWARRPDGGERKLRIDGLTYGGFRKDRGEPAERLMQALRERFSGELIEYDDGEPEVAEREGGSASEA